MLATPALAFLAVAWTASFIALSAADGLLGWDLRFAYLPAADAIRHSRRENPYVWIDVGEDGDFYKFCVGDDGPGIAPEFHEKIWETFQTLEPRDKVEGTGIGLALVRKHVVSRGGRAWVESREGQGASFFFLWPKAARG